MLNKNLQFIEIIGDGKEIHTNVHKTLFCSFFEHIYEVVVIAITIISSISEKPLFDFTSFDLHIIINLFPRI